MSAPDVLSSARLNQRRRAEKRHRLFHENLDGFRFGAVDGTDSLGSSGHYQRPERRRQSKRIAKALRAPRIIGARIAERIDHCNVREARPRWKRMHATHAPRVHDCADDAARRALCGLQWATTTLISMGRRVESNLLRANPASR